jgi:hypothetical protein
VTVVATTGVPIFSVIPPKPGPCVPGTGSERVMTSSSGTPVAPADAVPRARSLKVTAMVFPVGTSVAYMAGSVWVTRGRTMR